MHPVAAAESDLDYLEHIVRASAEMDLAQLAPFQTLEANPSAFVPAARPSTISFASLVVPPPDQKPPVPADKIEYFQNDNFSLDQEKKAELINELYRLHLEAREGRPGGVPPSRSPANPLATRSDANRSDLSHSRMQNQNDVRRSKIERILADNPAPAEVDPDHFDYLNDIFQQVDASLAGKENVQAPAVVPVQPPPADARHSLERTVASEISSELSGSLQKSQLTSRQAKFESLKKKFEMNRLSSLANRDHVVLEKNSITSDDVGEHETFELTMNEDGQGNLMFGVVQHESIQAYSTAQLRRQSDAPKISHPQPAGLDVQIFPKKTLEDNENTFSESDKGDKGGLLKVEELQALKGRQSIQVGDGSIKYHPSPFEGLRNLKPVFTGPKYQSVLKAEGEETEMGVGAFRKALEVSEQSYQSPRSPKKSIASSRKSDIKVFESEIEKFNQILDNPDETRRSRLSLRKSIPIFLEDAVVAKAEALELAVREERSGSKKKNDLIKREVDENLDLLVKHSLEMMQQEIAEEAAQAKEGDTPQPISEEKVSLEFLIPPETQTVVVEAQAAVSPAKKETVKKQVQFQDDTVPESLPVPKYRKTVVQSQPRRPGAGTDRIRALFEALPVEEQHRLEIEYKNQVMVAMNTLLARRQFSKGGETTELLKEKMRQMVRPDFLYYCSQLTAADLAKVVRLQRLFREKLDQKIQEKIRFSNMHFALLKTEALQRRTVKLRMSHLGAKGRPTNL